MTEQKLIHQLFIGKIADTIGIDKTTQLLREATDAFKDTTKENMSGLMIEPELIKAGDNRVLLGHAKTPLKVDARVVSEDNYQKLKKAFDLYDMEYNNKPPHTTEIVQKYGSSQEEVKYRRQYGSKEALELMQDVDNRCRKFGYFYRHVC